MTQNSDNESYVVADIKEVGPFEYDNECCTTMSEGNDNESTVSDSSQSSNNESTVADSSQSSDNESTVADSSGVNISKQTLKEKIIKSCDVEESKYDEIRSAIETRKRESVTEIEDITVGCEISYGRWGYKHHAVVVDVDTENDQYMIIHLSGDSYESSKASSSSGDGKAKPRSEWMTMKQTKQDKTFYYYYIAKCTAIPFESDVIIGRAEALMKVFPGSDALNYDLRKFNCQHFASYCVTGVPYCKPYNKMLCCCKRGTAINFDFKKILDDQLKGKKTPPQLSRPLPSETQHLKTDNNGRAQVSTERGIHFVYKPCLLPSTSAADVVRPLPRITQLVKGGIQLEPLGDSTSEKKKKKEKRKKRKELKQFDELY